MGYIALKSGYYSNLKLTYGLPIKYQYDQYYSVLPTNLNGPVSKIERRWDLRTEKIIHYKDGKDVGVDRFYYQTCGYNMLIYSFDERELKEIMLFEDYGASKNAEFHEKIMRNSDKDIYPKLMGEEFICWP